MNGRFRFLLVTAVVTAFALSIALAGCASSGSSSAASSSSSGASSSSVASSSANSQEVVLDNEDVVFIGLDYNAGTGYEWTCKMDPEGVIAITNQETENLDNGQVTGGALREVFDLRPIKPGEVTLTFQLAREWEDGEPAEEQVYAFTVSEDLRIILNPYKSNFDNEPVWGSNS